MGRACRHLFIAAHIAAIVGWAVPSPDAVRIPVRRLIRPYMELSGLAQTWDLLAPNPRRVNVRLEAEVTHLDGSISRWDFLQAKAPLGPFGRYRQLRYRNWAVDRVYPNGDRFHTWRDTARYVARQLFTESWNPPTSVAFTRGTQRITIDPLIRDVPEGFAPVRYARFYTYRTDLP